MSTMTCRQLAAYDGSLHGVGSVPPNLAKETIYMPSAVAARELGGVARIGSTEASCDSRDESAAA